MKMDNIGDEIMPRIRMRQKIEWIRNGREIWRVEIVDEERI